MIVSPPADRPESAPPADWFAGEVAMRGLYPPDAPPPDAPGRVAAVSVTFAPGARTAWHTHPAGQLLVITAGRGHVQAWGGPVREVGPGDTVWFPPGEKHWHGAAPDAAMTHIAMQEAVDGRTVDWMEHVTD